LDSIKNYYPTYQFIYAAFSYNQMPGSLAYMDSKYNFAYVPTTYFDGGQNMIIGGEPATSAYRSRIQAAGARATHDLYLAVSVEYVNSTQLLIHYEVASRENRAPSAAGQPTTNCIMFANGSSRSFSAQATEPEGDQLLYRWAFGDGDSSVWMGPYNSGETCVAEHQWAVPGQYNVKVLAKDVFDMPATWSPAKTVTVTDCTCGNANGDAAINISDAVFLISYIFAGGASPGPCSCDGTGNERGDANGDYVVNISDAVYLIAYIFAGGAPPHCP
jgi:hypothetical protein